MGGGDVFEVGRYLLIGGGVDDGWWSWMIVRVGCVKVY